MPNISVRMREWIQTHTRLRGELFYDKQLSKNALEGQQTVMMMIITMSKIRGCTSGGVDVPCILLACQLTVTVGDSGLCCRVCVTSLER